MAFNILPVRRDFKFNVNPARALHWHANSLNVTQFLNTMSSFLPVGERFFIDAVRSYRDQISDPELKKAVTAFIGQEAMHGREHEDYNDAIASHGVPIQQQEAFVLALLNFVQKNTPKAIPLAGTVALEHMTAILADGLLSLPNIMEVADEDYKALWNWHALEETEHKAVAYDVFQTVIGKDDNLGAYALRSFALVAATSIFFSIFIPFFVHNIRIKGGLFDLNGWKDVARLTWGKKGIFRYITPLWFDWFKPGFHPWDHDNHHYLEEFEERLAYVLKTEAA